MCIFLKNEIQRATDAAEHYRVMQNLQISKRQRVKRRLSKLLVSKRGLAAAFAAGAARDLMRSTDSTANKQTSKASKVARMSLSAWLTGS